MRFTWGAVYALLWIYRSVFSYLAQAVILRLTSVPDTSGYQAFGFSQLTDVLNTTDVEVGPLMQRHAGLVTQVVAAILNILTGGNAVLINIGFQSIAFAGIVYFLHGLDTKTRTFILVLVMTPSFTLWSSIASKESLVVFLTCILSRYVVDIYRGCGHLTFLRIGALLLTIGMLYIFKPHFIPALLFVAGTSKAAQYVREKATVALFAAGASVLALYLVRESVDRFARLVTTWVTAEPGVSNRSRGASLIVNQYDVFVNAPQGMFQAFLGPTLDEAMTGGVLHLASFAEGILMIVVLATVVVWRLPRMPVYSAVLAGFTALWTMFANYPVGLANPGTAVRYRTDYLVLIFLALAVLTSRRLYVEWQANSRQRQPRTRVRWSAFASTRGQAVAVQP